MRDAPRISINKLGEYVHASAARRQSIVADQKNNKPFKSMWYDYALPVARQYVVLGEGDPKRLVDEAETLRAAQHPDPQMKKYQHTSADALDSLAAMADALEIDADVRLVGPEQPPKMMVADVAVSVRPDVILRATSKSGEPTFGLLKFHFSKSNPLTRDAGLDVAALLHWYGEAHLPEYGTCDRRLCSVVEVFGNDVHVAPAAVKRRREGITAACKEICLWWNVV